MYGCGGARERDASAAHTIGGFRIGASCPVLRSIDAGDDQS